MKYLIKYELINSKSIIITMTILYAVNMFFTLGLFSVGEVRNPFNMVFIFMFILWRGNKLIKDIDIKHNLIEHLLPVDRQVFMLAKIVSSAILFIPILGVMLLFQVF